MTKKREPFYPQDERPPDASGVMPDGTKWEVRALSLDEAAASMGTTEAELAERLRRLESGEAKTIPFDEWLAARRRERAH